MESENREKKVCQADGIPYQAWEEPDLRWLREYGTVFQVMDQLSSGNLCFGVEGRYGKLFIKYAGAQTVNARCRPEEAIRTLRHAMPLYEREHPSLARLMAHGTTGEGYAAIFQWAEGRVLRTAPGDTAVYRQMRFMQPVRALKMLDGVYDLHAMLAADGYIAVDFYDGNLLLDFSQDRAIVCDIDLYRRKPAVNDRGRMPGSSRFMAPEEFTLNAPLTESTTVYTMGALAYAFFGDVETKSAESWFGPKQLLPIAQKAVSAKPGARYPSLRSFLKAWREAVGSVRL